ncbi:MAG: glycerol-3-phosphate dehydrogenase/oxidase [Candidatus Latescibacteria bacterium]|nr:glycerol-3-phosphate dehydrogenase/oxidase [Candidatus Latescibacterota bacterium]
MTYDVIILGAGINGCGIAQALSEDGQKVLVLDKGVIGGGTSSKSSRLIHGGLRYLETMRFGLVREALRDRLELLRQYPDLVEMRPFFLPIYKTSPRPAWMLWVGVKLYDVLAGWENKYRSGFVNRDAFEKDFSALKQDGVVNVLKYYDGKTNDWALTRRVAEDAKALGCVFCEQVDVAGLSWNEQGFEVRVGEEVYRSRKLVNATGPWIDEVVAQHQLPARFQIRKISGIHIFIEGLLTPEPMFLQAHGKRIFFIIPEPENGHTMIGTTEREEGVGIDDVDVQEADVDYLLEQVNAYLKSDRQIRREDVVDASVGVRPLVANKEDPTDLSREYELDLHTKGDTQLLNIFGGKLTTYLSLAQHVVKVLKGKRKKEKGKGKNKIPA